LYDATGLCGSGGVERFYLRPFRCEAWRVPVLPPRLNARRSRSPPAPSARRICSIRLSAS